MASDSSSSKSKILDDSIPTKLSHLKSQILASRSASIKERLEKNRVNLRLHTCTLLSSDDAPSCEENVNMDMLSRRMVAGNEMWGVRSGWEDVKELEEVSMRRVKLPHVEKIPPYTTWIFLDRNQRMAEDQSVVGRRRIYYDPYGNETLLCSDSDEEIAEPEEEKHDFSEGEDQLLWKALQEHGVNQQVLDHLCQFIEATPSEIEERYETLMDKYQEKNVKDHEGCGELKSEGKLFLDKTLSAALDSFDNLFCRRCLTFDCRLHGCSQSLIITSEKQSHGFEVEENRNPCGDQCYLKMREDAKYLCHDSSDAGDMRVKEPTTSTENMGTEETSRMKHPGATCDSDKVVPEVHPKVIRKRKVLKHEDVALGKCRLATEKCFTDKKQKIVSASDLPPVGGDLSTDTTWLEAGTFGSDQLRKEAIDESPGHSSRKDVCHDNRTGTVDADSSGIKVSLGKNVSSSSKEQASHGWTAMEKDLFLKGIEIFGKNRSKRCQQEHEFGAEGVEHGS